MKKQIAAIAIVLLASLSSINLLANTSTYMTPDEANGGETIYLNRNEDLLIPSSLKAFTPSSIMSLSVSTGVSSSYGYDSAISDNVYHFVFSGAGYFTITFKYFQPPYPTLWVLTYNIWIAPNS